MNKLAHFITYSKAATYIAALLCVVSWWFQRGGNLLADVCSLVLILVAGVLLVRVNREFSLSDSKSTLPITLFFMGCGIASDLWVQGGVGLLFVLFSLACYILLRTYRERDAVGRYFAAFVLIGIQCMLAPPLLLTLPLLVLCGVFMESLHLRTFFAALWGLVCPFWIVCGILFLIDRTEFIAPYLDNVVSMASPSHLWLYSPHRWVQLLWAMLIALPSSVVVLLNRTMKLQTSVVFRLLIGALVVLFISMWMASAYYAALLPCVMMGVALLGSALFATDNSRARNIYLIVLVLFWIFLFVQPLWNSYWHF